jgi:tetratricopeptide (TPR) repeat protein
MDLKKVHRIIAGLLLAVTLIIYLTTIAPTLSFWDCGEFIACSYTLSVPHPPGSPLYLLMGKIFSMIPFGDIGWRVNLISAIVSAFSVMLLYLTIVRLVRLYRGREETVQDALINYGGAVIGALAYAFTHSHWFNAVEAEVYSISLFFTSVVFYLIIRWADEADDPASDRLLLIIAYLMGLAIGVHLLNILAIPAIALVVYFRKYKFSWSSFFITVALTLVATSVIYPGIVKYLPATFKISAFLPLLVFIGVLWAAFWALKNHRRLISIALMSVFLIMLGYSTYATIFIRSNLNPPIDENNPDTVERFLSYLNREQYGEVGIFPRRWNNDPEYRSESDFFWRYQVDHMYNRYFLWQFVGQDGDYQGARVDFTKFYALPFILGLFGLAHHVSRDRRRALVVLSLFFMTGYAIIMYLNQDNPQPRERDYAYTGSFYAFAVWIGIGAQGVLAYVSRWLKQKGSLLHLGLVLAALFVVVPFNMFAKNYHMHSRAGNYVAWDYSRNILETCEPNGLIFTNGDNDTFPLWYLQEVMGVRKDVRVVNLSLLNTGWYIKQLKYEEPRVPISFSDDYIDRYLDQHDLTALRARYWPKNDPNRPTTIRLEKPDGSHIEWDVPATMHLPTGQGDTGEPNFLRVQDVMIIDIVRASKWKRPIYFAVTVSNSNMLGLQDNLTMEGLAFKLVPESGNKINPEKLKENLLISYRDYYRNLDNPNIHYDDNVYRLLQNYRSAYLQLATYYLQRNQPGTVAYDHTQPSDETIHQFEQFSDKDKVLFILDRMEEYLPDAVVPISSDEIVLHIGQLYTDLGRPDELQKSLDRLTSRRNLTAEQLFRYGAVYLHWMNDTAAAKSQFEKVLDADDSPAMQFELATAYHQMKMNDEAIELLDQLREETLDPELEIRMGSLYYKMDHLEEAQDLFENLAMRKPGDGSVIGGLLMVYERQRDYHRARELLQSWVEAHPNDIQAQNRLQRFEEMAQDSTP